MQGCLKTQKGKKGKEMNILGFMGWASHDPGACVIKVERDGRYRFCALSEERLNRIKYSYHFPLRSIRYCMDVLGIDSFRDIDLVINDWSQHSETLTSNMSYRCLEYDYIRRNLKIDKSKIKLIPSHHLAHAYSAFIPSGFDEAAILIVDAIGSNLQGTSLYVGKGTDIKFVSSSGSYSLGKLYDTVTRQILKFGIGEDGKTMGLAAFGEKYRKDPSILNIKGRYDGLAIDYSRFMRRIPDNGLLNKGIRKCVDKEEIYSPYFSKVAWEAQVEIEKAMLYLAKYAKETTGCQNLCIAGGVGLNCVSNERIRKEGAFKNIYIQPASSDCGVPFGLALYGYYIYAGAKSFKPALKNVYIGRNYADEEVIDVLKKFSIPYQDVSVDEVAKLLTQKKVVGWFSGGSESGPRALGHRSILADPRFPDMKDILNMRVKHRELYRPFAPSVLEEFAKDYFEIDDAGSPYMLLAPMIRPEKAKKIPAVVHVDGSGRVQTVSKENCPEYHKLISAFYNITGVPVILNTSFNDNDEPMVESPLDALICFLRTDIDYLVYHGRIIVKKTDIPNKSEIADKAAQSREDYLKAEYKQLLKEFLNAYSANDMKEFLKLKDRISNYYKFYCSYTKLLDFIVQNKDYTFIGDETHFKILQKVSRDLFIDLVIKDRLLIEDRLENLPKVIQKIKQNPTNHKILIGLYNMSELLKQQVRDNSNVFIIYDDYQAHLNNAISGYIQNEVDVSGIESYSCEYNLDDEFDKLFK